MNKFYLCLIALSILVGCGDDKLKIKLDGEELLDQKCSSCHNLDMPPKNYDNEVAPSMMAVTFHLKDFIKTNNPSELEAKMSDFVQDYVINPSASKSFCDKESLENYGVMPSQKGKVSKDELRAISHYMYDTYDNQKMLLIMQKKARLARMPLHERVLEQQRCTNCHGINKDKVAPSFQHIAQRYNMKDKSKLIISIKNGSKGKWDKFKLIMPPYKKMSDKEVNGMVDWILTLKK